MADSKKPRASGDDYEVGYGRPPRSGQFKPGQSGNPSGKRRGKHLLTLIDQELDTTIRFTEGGKAIKLSKRELMVKALVNQAVKGDLRAIEMLARMAGGSGTDEAPIDLAGISPATIASFLRRHGTGSGSGGDGEEGGHAQ